MESIRMRTPPFPGRVVYGATCAWLVPVARDAGPNGEGHVITDEGCNETKRMVDPYRERFVVVPGSRIGVQSNVANVNGDPRRCRVHDRFLHEPVCTTDPDLVAYEAAGRVCPAG